jgi:hypothetical protein
MPVCSTHRCTLISRPLRGCVIDESLCLGLRHRPATRSLSGASPRAPRQPRVTRPWATATTLWRVAENCFLGKKNFTAAGRATGRRPSRFGMGCGPGGQSRCTVSGENAGTHTAMYSAPSGPGVL